VATLQPGEKARMYALGGIMRGGASRGGYVDNRLYINIDGAQLTGNVLLDTLTITDQLDEAPNTCSFRVHDVLPEDGAEITITRGSSNGARWFAGYALTVQEGYVGVPHHVQADVQAVDYTWLLGMRKVTGQYLNQSATTIVQDLVQRFAGENGFTTVNVAAGLPALDQVTFTDEELPAAITRVVRRIGAYWYVDYHKDVHVFFTEPHIPNPEPLWAGHRSLAGFTATRERTQALTRVLVEGRGSTLLAGVVAGETMLPLEAVDMFTPGPDVFLKVSVAGADSAWHLDFTGVVPSGGGSLVGPGAAPSSGPTLSGAAGGAIELGAHSYAYTWVTAAGETKPSPATAITVPSTIAAPTLAPFVTVNDSPVNPAGGASTWRPGNTVEFAASYSYGAPYDPAASTPLGPIAGPFVAQTSPMYFGTPGDSAKAYTISLPLSPNPGATRIYLWHRVNGGAWYVWYSGDGQQNVQGGDRPPGWSITMLYDKPHSYATTAPTIPGSLPSPGSVIVSGIATGPATVTARKLYRTKANQAPLLLVTTGAALTNNTATTYTDTAADATLGAAVPVGDTSGLQAPTGTVNAGDTSLIVASTAPFTTVDGRGWALVGEQAIRYAGIEVGRLVGIPRTGYGAIVGPIQYNTSIRSAPLLTGIPASGVRSLGVPLNAGDEVYAVVQVDDEARQAQLAADLNVASGIREEWIQDRRLSITEARARGRATLLARPLTDATVEYTCRDTKTASGQTIEVNLPAPINVVGYFKIQQVTWSKFRPRAEQPPTARVLASNRRFSFEDLLRIVKTKD
jgi:hypothetical protein